MDYAGLAGCRPPCGLIHGGAAMVALVLLGALIPVHVVRAWRARRNRPVGVAMATANVLFIATAFGLYYAGSDTFRPCISDVHIAVDPMLPVTLLICSDEFCIGQHVAMHGSLDLRFRRASWIERDI